MSRRTLRKPKWGNSDVKKAVEEVLSRPGWSFSMKSRHACLTHEASKKFLIVRIGSNQNRAETPHQIRQNANRIEREAMASGKVFQT